MMSTSKALSFPCLDSEESLQDRKGMKGVRTQTHSEIPPAFPITIITHQLHHLHFQNPLQLELGFQYRHKCYQSLVEIREKSRMLPVPVFVKMNK